MSDSKSKLAIILGEERLGHMTTLCNDKDGAMMLNSQDIHCKCDTTVLKSKQAKLILTTQSMMDHEKKLFHFEPKHEHFKNLVKGCYWLVDDMFKFEHVAYSNFVKLDKSSPDSHKLPEDSAQKSSVESMQNPLCELDVKDKKETAPNGIRYLLCAECEFGPIGWFDSEKQESYLHVW